MECVKDSELLSTRKESGREALALPADFPATPNPFFFFFLHSFSLVA